MPRFHGPQQDHQLKSIKSNDVFKESNEELGDVKKSVEEFKLYMTE